MRIKKIVATLASFGLIASPLAYATDGYFSDGYGMKSIGMAGVGIALPQDAIAAANNPAGMVMVGDRIDMGISLLGQTEVLKFRVAPVSRMARLMVTAGQIS